MWVRTLNLEAPHKGERESATPITPDFFDQDTQGGVQGFCSKSLVPFLFFSGVRRGGGVVVEKRKSTGLVN